MTLPRETLATGATHVCPDCEQPVLIGVYHSAAGYYVGSYCNCGPYSRESGYYRTHAEAEAAFKSGKYFRP